MDSPFLVAAKGSAENAPPAPPERAVGVKGSCPKGSAADPQAPKEAGNRVLVSKPKASIN